MTATVEVAPAENVHKSRWGYHPCDYETFLMIRKIHKAYWQAVRQRATLQRWLRKEPQNRVSRAKIRDFEGRVCGRGEPVPLPQPFANPVFVTVVDKPWVGLVAEIRHAGIVEEYRNSRRPKTDASEVKPIKMPLVAIAELAATL